MTQVSKDNQCSDHLSAMDVATWQRITIMINIFFGTVLLSTRYGFPRGEGVFRNSVNLLNQEAY